MSDKRINIDQALEGLAAVIGNTTYGKGKIGQENVCFDWVRPTDVKSGRPKIAIVLDDDKLVSEDVGEERRKAKLIIGATWLHDQTDPTQHRIAPLESMRLAMAVRDMIKMAMKDADGNGIGGFTIIEERETGIEPRGHKDNDRVGWVGQNWIGHYTRTPNT